MVKAIYVFAKHSELLNYMLKLKLDLTFYFNTNCEIIPDIISSNAMVKLQAQNSRMIGGHEDSWDNSPGVYDDSVGCMQSIDVPIIG